MLRLNCHVQRVVVDQTAGHPFEARLLATRRPRAKEHAATDNQVEVKATASHADEGCDDEKTTPRLVGSKASVTSVRNTPFSGSSPESPRGVWVPLPSSEPVSTRDLQRLGVHLAFGALEWLYSLVLMLVIHVLSTAKTWMDWRERRQAEDAPEVDLRKLQKSPSFSVYQSVTQLRGLRSQRRIPKRMVGWHRMAAAQNQHLRINRTHLAHRWRPKYWERRCQHENPSRA